MKYIKLIPFILCISIFITVPSFAGEAIVNVDNLNIRSGPGIEYSRIGQLQKGEAYHIIQQKSNWIEIQFKSGKGWIHSDYITMTENIEEAKKTSNTIQINQKTAHIRSGPSTENDIIYVAAQGEVFQLLSETGTWYELTNDKISGFVLKEVVSKEENHQLSNALANKTIVIDAGHGGYDVGAIGANGSYEKDLTYLTAKELERNLKALGVNVLLTRIKDEFISLGSRASFSNISNADAFISIHYNSFKEQPDVTGIETFYYYEESKALANYIQQEIIKNTNSRDRGVEHGDLYVLRKNTRPAVLLELGFISNKESENKLKTKAYQKQIVTGIINGLRMYFMNEYRKVHYQ